MDRHSLAIIGAGPAGYTLAQELVKTNAFDIDIFEKEKEIGGAIYTGIPDYRMPKTFLTKAYEGLVENGANVEIHSFASIEQNQGQPLSGIIDGVKYQLSTYRKKRQRGIHYMR